MDAQSGARHTTLRCLPGLDRPQQLLERGGAGIAAEEALERNASAVVNQQALERQHGPVVLLELQLQNIVPIARVQRLGHVH